METTKYYFEQEFQGLPKTNQCTFFNRELFSHECKNCDNFRGFDKEEKWIKCYLYHFYTIAISQTNMINRYQKNIKDRNERLDFLNKKLIDAYSKIDDYKDSFGEFNTNGGY